MNRRSFLIGTAASLVAAPAIVRAESLMALRGVPAYGTSPAMPAIERLYRVLCGKLFEAKVAAVYRAPIDMEVMFVLNDGNIDHVHIGRLLTPP
jgi:hypothetical protein